MSIISYFREENLPVRPWTRFFARSIDIIIISNIIKILHLYPASFFGTLLVLNLAYIFTEAVALSKFGTTVGKALMSITVTDNEKNRLSFSAALKRTFLVYLRGLAFKIPLVDLIPLIMAYNKLKKDQITSWDEDCHTVVTHQNPSLRKWLIAVLCVVIYPIFMVVLLIFQMRAAADDFLKQQMLAAQTRASQIQTSNRFQPPQDQRETPPAAPTTPAPNDTSSPSSEDNSASSEQNPTEAPTTTTTPDNSSSSAGGTQDTPTNGHPSWMHEVPSNTPRPTPPNTPNSDQSTSSGD